MEGANGSGKFNEWEFETKKSAPVRRENQRAKKGFFLETKKMKLLAFKYNQSGHLLQGE
jgi:hypothetical protein